MLSGRDGWRQPRKSSWTRFTNHASVSSARLPDREHLESPGPRVHKRNLEDPPLRIPRGQHPRRVHVSSVRLLVHAADTAEILVNQVPT